MLFRIRDSDCYILGAVHALHESLQSLPHEWWSVWKQSECIAFEARFDQFDGVTDGEFSEGKNLLSDIGIDTYSKVEKLWVGLNLDKSALMRVKGWRVLMVLNEVINTRIGLHPKFGIDTRFMNETLAVGNKQILALETVDTSLESFRLMAINEQIQMLNDLCDDPAGTSDRLIFIVNAWRDGAIFQLGQFLESRRQIYPEFFQALFDKRNNAWTPAIIDIARHGVPTLIIVGALHLVGTDSLEQILKHHGITLDFISSYANRLQ